MYQGKGLGTVVLLTMFVVSAAAGQQEPADDSESRKPMGDMPMMQDGGEENGMGSMKMEHMADAMTSMAKTCDTMMKREMRMFPVKMAAIGILGILGAIGLALLIVLEVQWIRLLGVRIRQSKRDLGQHGKT